MAKKKANLDQQLEQFVKQHPFIAIGVFCAMMYLLFGSVIKSYLQLYLRDIVTPERVELTKHVVWSIIVGGIVLVVLRHFWVRWYHRKGWEYQRLLPHEDDRFRPADVLGMLDRIHGSRRNGWKRLILGREWFTYVIHRDAQGNVAFYVGAHHRMLPFLKSSIQSIHHRAEFYPAEDLVFPDDAPNKHRYGGRMKMRKKRGRDALPLAEYKYDQLAMFLLEMPINSWLQVNFSPNNGHKIKEKVVSREATIKERKAADRSAFDKQELKGLKERYVTNRGAYDATISIATTEPRQGDAVKQLGNHLRASLNDINTVRYRKYRNSVRKYPQFRRFQMLMTGEELANVVHLPLFDDRKLITKLKERVPRSQEGAELIPENVMANPADVFIGHLVHPVIKQRAVYLQKEYIGEHFGLTGKTGSGKSTVLNTLISNGFIQDFIEQETAAGLTFNDPAKDTIIVILNQLLRAEAEGKKVNWEKVHYFSIANTEHPFALNLLYKMPGQNEALIADAVTELIEANFAQPAVVAERLLRYCIRTLLADKYATHTILEVSRLLDDARFRRNILSGLMHDPRYYEITQYWENDGPGNIKTSGLAVKNRIDMFASSLSLKRVFGQKEFDLDIRTYMEEGHIVLIDMSNLSEREIGLVAGYLEYMYYRIAETRAPYSLLHLFVTDERHKMANISITPKIIAESRKFGLSSGTSTQRLMQLSEAHRDALTEIQDNFFVCQQGPEDAKLAAKYLTVGKKDALSPTYLQNLEPLRVVIKTKEKVHGVVNTYRITVSVPPLNKYKPDLTLAKHRDKEDTAIANEWTYAKAKELESREGKSLAEVDLAIMRYMQPDGDFSELEEQAREEAMEAEIEEPEVDVTDVEEEKPKKPKSLLGLVKPREDDT